MSLSRLLPDRWARILTWTTAAVAWGTTTVAVSAAASSSEAPEPTTGATQPGPVRTETVAEPLPEAPSSGLVIIRYTPAEAPPAQVITRTVTVAGGGAAASAPVAGGAAPAAPSPAAPAPQPTTVVSSGS